MSFEETIQKIGIDNLDVIEWREAKIDDSKFGETGTTFKGYIILTKENVIFVSKKGIIKSARKVFEIPIQKIKKITKVPLIKQWLFEVNFADEKAGVLKKLFKTKTFQVSITDGKSFVEKIK